MPDRARCRRNRMRTTLLLVVPSGLLVVSGYALAGSVGLGLGAAGATVLTVGAYFGGGRIALRSMRAYPVSEADHAELTGLVRELAMTMRLPMPAVAVSPTPCPNAFVTGRTRRRTTICVTEGLLVLLDRRELRAVLAHELAHVANRDSAAASVAAGLAGMIMYVAQLAWLLPFGRADDDDANPIGALLLLALGPVAAMLLQAAISRSRELEADRTAAQVTGEPLALASALRRLEERTSQLPLPPDPGLRSTAALMITSPFRSRGFISLFRTHPSTARRIARLESLAL